MKSKITTFLFFVIAALFFFSCTNKNKGEGALETINTIADLKDKKIGVLSGSMADKLVLQKIPSAEILYFNDITDGSNAVLIGKIDAFAYDIETLKPIVNKNKEFTILQELITEDQYGIAVNQNNPELKAIIDSVIDSLKSSGEYEAIKKRWLSNSPQPDTLPIFNISEKNGTLHFGTCSQLFPFSFLNSKREIIGFDIEIMNHIAQALDKKLEIIDMNFGALIPGLISEKCDVIAACITISEERERSVLFSKPYCVGGIGILVKNNEVVSNRKTDKLASAEDLKNKRIAILLGTTQDQYVSTNFPDAQIMRLDNSTDAITMIKSGQCDATIIENSIAQTFLSQNPDLAIFDKDLFVGEIGFGFHDETLKQQFNTFLAELKASGELEAITRKWEEKKEKALFPDFPEWSGENGELIIGTTGTDVPYSFIHNQQLVGLDIEIATLFAISQNKKITFEKSNFAALIPALASKKVDIIAACISITEERAKIVHFSDPYYFSSTVAVCLKKNVANSKDNDTETYYYSVNDLQDKTIGVLIGSTQDQYATQQFPNATILRLDERPDLLLSLKQKQCDGIILDEFAAGILMKDNPEIAYIDNKLFRSSYATGFPKEKEALQQQFNHFLQTIKENGVYDELYHRWITNTDSAEMPAFDFSKTNGTLRIGTTGLSIPFSYYKNDQIVGFEIEMMMRFAASINKKPIITTYKFDGLLASVINNKEDMIVNSIMITEERKKKILFSDTYLDNASGMIVLADKIGKEKIRYILKNDGSDIATSKIGVMTGTIGEMIVNNNYPQADIKCFDDIMDAILALQNRKIKYVLTAYTTAMVAVKKIPELSLLPQKLSSDQAIIAIGKGNDKLRIQINELIKKYKENGTLTDLHQRWTKNITPNYQYKKLEPIQNGKVLKVGIAANREPMCFIKDGKIIGLDAELIELIAHDLGMKVEYYDMKFSALIPALTSHKVDVVISNMSATEERAKMVDFSDSYFDNYQVLITTQDKIEEQTVEKEKWFTKIKESFYNNILLEKRYLLLLDGFKVTLIITLLSTLLGTLLGGLVCAMRMSKRKIWQIISKIYIDLLRGIPQVVLLMIMFYVIFAKLDINGIIVASITFALNFSAYVSEMFRTSISSIDRGQSEAGIALGFSKVKTFINIILPQAIQRVLPVYKGEFIALVKMTAIVGYIAVQDLTKAGDIIRSRTFDAFFPLIMIAIIYFLLSWILIQLLNYLEFKSKPKRHQ